MKSEKPIIHSFRALARHRNVVHGFFTRHGGVSRPPYDTLNVAWNNGDRPEHVQENLLRVKQALGLETLVASPQVHGDTINVVNERGLTTAAHGFPVMVTSPADALVTRMRGVGLLIKIADCQAIMLYDPEKQVVANVHCGWRGSVKDFPAKVVRFLQTEFGCRPDDLLAAIGPSLGPCCSEFINYKEELPQTFLEYHTKPNHFDFWAISRDQLVGAGVSSENIEIAGRCTVCERDDFFSYRGEGKTGRMAGVIALRERN
jgi:YfiH family protein